MDTRTLFESGADLFINQPYGVQYYRHNLIWYSRSEMDEDDWYSIGQDRNLDDPFTWQGWEEGIRPATPDDLVAVMTSLLLQ